MAATPSQMIPLGTLLPEFSLRDTVSGRTFSWRDLPPGKPALVMFLCNHCPFVKHVRAEIARLARDYQPRSLSIVAISSNDVQKYPDDSPEKMKLEAADAGYTFPYLFDESQEVAKSFSAACTPDFFLFDGSRPPKLVYRGQLDESRPKNDKPVTGRDLRAAIDAVLAGREPGAQQWPSIGCNIKWRPGNEPPYAK